MQHKANIANISLMTEHGKGGLRGQALLWILIVVFALLSAVVALWARKQPDYSELPRLEAHARSLEPKMTLFSDEYKCVSMSTHQRDNVGNLILRT